MLINIRRGASTLAKQGIFHRTTLQLSLQLRASWIDPHEIEKHQDSFDLATMFKSTLAIKPDNFRYGHTHRLLMLHHQNKPVAISGLEIGCGEALQCYVGEYHKKVLIGPTCLVHVVEVRPEFRGHGLQTWVWSEIGKLALQHQFENLAFNPIDSEKFNQYFLRLGVHLENHLLSQPIWAGTNANGAPIYRGEDSIDLAIIRKNDIARLCVSGFKPIESASVSQLVA